MSCMFQKALMAGAVFLLLANGDALAAGELKISGSATVAAGVVNPNKAAIEQETGLKVNVIVNGDGNGLKDLYAGKSDVAMVASPIKLTEANLNKANPGSISIEGFEVVPVGGETLRFIVHPSNPIKTLTEAQLKDIFTGKITSWKDVGGGDQPIIVVTAAQGLGQRTLVVNQFLGGTEITDKARPVQSFVQLSQIVAQAPNAIGYGNGASITPAVAPVAGAEIKQVLALVTKGPPTPDAKKFIEAAAKLGAAKK